MEPVESDKGKRLTLAPSLHPIPVKAKDRPRMSHPYDSLPEDRPKADQSAFAVVRPAGE